MLRLTITKSGIVPAAVRAISSSTYAHAVEGLKGFSENEKAVEDLYFTKEDQRVLGKILNKVKEQSDIKDIHAAAGVRAAEISAVQPLITKYKIAAEDVHKLLAWKHTQY
ncbi:hypothetical protein CEUSTIGMA_g4114.t1 [Chlamydomonas eustigma]|uniref:Uncharacterized protein n=1 Tax=Chlamydomonas eustigma TaxID=1157962 RepID=A0A250X0R1_9CHLO|nr:hypothetical protein CEUSTIGMA_g4114.t1 [Chlamydomonas eustigma]|eukprot:GAX76668.1 hypothetical protein CEUSTIGMA_g4114.t1 [Chlamydomonas eustigma]